jgi:hypothetical protein
MPWVTLTDEQHQMRVECGTARRETAARRNRTEWYGTPADAKGNTFDLLHNDITSSGGELAVSLWTGLPWRNEIIEDALIDYPCDVGEDIEVKWTRYDHGYLWCSDQDNIDFRYVLVTAEPMAMRYRIAGWLPGSKLMDERNWRKSPRGIWQFQVKQHRLRSALELSKSYTNK